MYKANIDYNNTFIMGDRHFNRYAIHVTDPIKLEKE